MYRLEDLKQVGWMHLAGGIVTLLAGIVVQALVGFPFERVVANNFIYYVLFAIGWLLFNQIVMASVYNKLVDDEARTRLTRLDGPLTGGPAGRWGQSYTRMEILLMAIWVLSVVVIQLLLGQNLTLPIGGFAGGWLVGGGLGRLRFAGKLRQEQAEQQRRFYFSDATLGPRTQIAYYSERPDDLQPVETSNNDKAPAASAETSLPPGVKRRANFSPSQDK